MMRRQMSTFVRNARRFSVAREEDVQPINMLPHESKRKADLVLGNLLNGVWQKRRVVYTTDTIGFAKENEETMIDVIIMSDIDCVEEMDDNQLVKLGGTKKKLLDDAKSPTKSTAKASRLTTASYRMNKYSNAFKIETNPESHNSGRTYYLQADSKERCSQICKEIARLAKEAKARKDRKSTFERSQRVVRTFVHTSIFQNFAALLIIANFFTSIAQSEVGDGDKTLESLDLFFTMAFTAEVCLNAYAHWFHEWVHNGWSMLDFVVVLISIVGIAVGGTGSPLGLVRLMRAVRMIQMLRLFGRVRPLKVMVEAISASVVPMIYAFLIMFVVVSVYSMVGVTLFQQSAPASFGMFSMAFLTLFFATTGAGQPLPLVGSDGTYYWANIMFICTYYMVVNWVLLQVCVCVLLDSFLSTVAASAEEEKRLAVEERRSQKRIRNPLEPLLFGIVKDYIDDDDLSLKLRTLFQVLDTEGVERLDSKAFCVAIKKLWYDPPIHLSESDFVSLTNNGTLCDASGKVGVAEFEAVMRQQVRLYTQSRLSEIGADYRTDADVEFTQLGALKMLLTEHLRTAADLTHIRRDLQQLLLQGQPQDASAAAGKQDGSAGKCEGESGVCGHGVVDSNGGVGGSCGAALTAGESSDGTGGAMVKRLSCAGSDTSSCNGSVVAAITPATLVSVQCCAEAAGSSSNHGGEKHDVDGKHAMALPPPPSPLSLPIAATNGFAMAAMPGPAAIEKSSAGQAEPDVAREAWPVAVIHGLSRPDVTEPPSEMNVFAMAGLSKDVVICKPSAEEADPQVDRPNTGVIAPVTTAHQVHESREWSVKSYTAWKNAQGASPRAIPASLRIPSPPIEDSTAAVGRSPPPTNSEASALAVVNNAELDRVAVSKSKDSFLPTAKLTVRLFLNANGAGRSEEVAGPVVSLNDVTPAANEGSSEIFLRSSDARPPVDSSGAEAGCDCQAALGPAAAGTELAAAGKGTVGDGGANAGQELEETAMAVVPHDDPPLLQQMSALLPRASVEALPEAAKLTAESEAPFAAQQWYEVHELPVPLLEVSSVCAAPTAGTAETAHWTSSAGAANHPGGSTGRANGEMRAASAYNDGFVAGVFLPSMQQAPDISTRSDEWENCNGNGHHVQKDSGTSNLSNSGDTAVAAAATGSGGSCGEYPPAQVGGSKNPVSSGMFSIRQALSGGGGGSTSGATDRGSR